MNIDITTLLIIAAIGLLAGALSGLLGVGGGIVIIPALVLFMGMNQQMAQGTSLAMMLLPIGILAVMNYYKQGYVNVQYAAVLAFVFIIGAYFGSKYAMTLPQAALRKVFGILLLVVSMKMIFGK